MNLLALGTIPNTTASSNFGGRPDGRSARANLDLHSLQRGSAVVITIDRPDQPSVVAAAELPRILLVDAALALSESHVVLLRSIPARVTILSACRDMYVHNERDYKLVILVLSPESRETAEAAQFARHRWSTARILLIEGESVTVDDWLYDDRVDPNSEPRSIHQAAVRLIPKSGCLAT